MEQPLARQPTGARLWLTRAAWLLAIWGCSVAALGIAAWLMKLVMRVAGMSAS